MPSTAVTSALPMTANWTSCSGVQLTFAPRSSTVVSPCFVGSWEAIAGRSMPGSVLSTKRAMAISAPVLPAETQACADAVLDQVDRHAHRRVFLPAQRVGRRLVHRDDFAGRVDRHAIARRRARPRQRLRERRLQSDQDHARVRRVLEELERCRDGDREAGVASHRINGNRDGQGHVGKKPAGGRRRPLVQ